MAQIFSLNAFLRSESGAVTTDWVPLVGATVGLGLAVTGVVSGGLSDLAGNIRDTLNGDIVSGSSSGSSGDAGAGDGAGDGSPVLLAMSDFAGGDDGWSVLVDEHPDPVLVDMLGPFYDQSGNPVVLNTYEFDPDTGFAIFEFDLATIGNWEAADQMRLFVNGVMIDATSLRGGSTQTVATDGSDATEVAYNFIERERVTRDVAEERLEIADHYNELYNADENYEATRSNVNTQSSYTVQVVITNPGEELEFGIGRAGDDPYGGEAWAVDNVGSYGADVLPVELGG